MPNHELDYDHKTRYASAFDLEMYIEEKIPDLPKFIEYFKTEKNFSNLSITVDSDYKELNQCYAFKTQKEAEEKVEKLNIAMNDYVQKNNVRLTLKK